MKKVLLHPPERLKIKIKLEEYNHLNKKSKDDNVTFIQQVPLHPTERLKRLEKINNKVNFVNEVANTKAKATFKVKKNTDKMKKTNTKKLMIGEFNFDAKEMLNKTLIFNTSMVDEEVIIDRIMDTINDRFNDKYWIGHKPGMNYFMLKLENGR